MENYHNSFAEFDRSVLTALMAAVSPNPQKAAYELLQRFPSFQQATRADYKELAAVVGEKGAKASSHDSRCGFLDDAGDGD